MKRQISNYFHLIKLNMRLSNTIFNSIFIKKRKEKLKCKMLLMIVTLVFGMGREIKLSTVFQKIKLYKPFWRVSFG